MKELKGGFLGKDISSVAEQLVKEAKISEEDVYFNFNNIFIWATKYMSKKDVLSIYEHG